MTDAQKISWYADLCREAKMKGYWVSCCEFTGFTVLEEKENYKVVGKAATLEELFHVIHI